MLSVTISKKKKVICDNCNRGKIYDLAAKASEQHFINNCRLMTPLIYTHAASILITNFLHAVEPITIKVMTETLQGHLSHDMRSLPDTLFQLQPPYFAECFALLTITIFRTSHFLHVSPSAFHLHTRNSFSNTNTRWKVTDRLAFNGTLRARTLHGVFKKL